MKTLRSGYRISFFLLLLITGFCEALLSQTYPSRNITMKDGLPSNQVNDILFDSRGIYWIGTSAGLVRWIGDNFTIYGIEQGLPAPNVKTMTEDRSGNLWLGISGAGLYKFDGRDFHMVIPEDSLPGDEITRIKHTPRWDMILIGTDEGFAVWQNGEISKFNPDLAGASVTSANITGFLESESFIYVLSYNAGRFRFCPDNKTVVAAVNADTRLRQVNSSYISGNNDTIWALPFSNDLIIDGQTGKKTIKSVSEITCFAEDPSGNLYLSGNSGPFSELGGIFTLKNDSLVFLNPQFGITAERVTKIIYDKSDNVIVAADSREGLFVLQPDLIQNEFEGLPPADELHVRAMLIPDDKTLWLLDQDEIYFKSPGSNFNRFDREILDREVELFMREIFHEKYSFLLDPEGSFDKYEELRKKGKYNFPNPYKQRVNNENIIFDNKVWFRPDEYDYLRNIRLNDFRDIVTGPESSFWILSNAGFLSLDKTLEAGYLDYFIASNEKLILTDSSTALINSHNRLKVAKLKDHYAEIQLINPPNSSVFTGMLPSEKGILLSCRNQGLFLFDDGNLKSLNSENPELPGSVPAIARDHKGNLVIATGSAGLQILSMENDSIKILHKIDPDDNLKGNQIHWIVTDNRGFLWVGTNQGANRINLNMLYGENIISVRFFDEEEGIYEPSVNATIADHNGDIWLGSNGFLTKINSAKIDELPPLPRSTFISRIDLDHRPVSWEEYFKTDPWFGIPESGVNLKHFQNNLTFYFNTANVAGTGKTLYRYRVIGLNEQWSPFDEGQQVVFPNLRPGRYRLEVESQLAYYSGSRGFAEFTFRILPPWWQTWWFYTILLLTLAGMFWLILILRVRHVKKVESRKLNLEREISELRIKALQSQMNPHFTFNAINSIQYYIIEKDNDSAFLYIGFFSKLIRQTLEFASRTSVSIKEELLFLENYIKLEQMRFQNKFSYYISINSGLESHKYHIPPLLLQPFVENAILHGLLHKKDEGMLRISFIKKDRDLLKCTVEDNGIGREKSAEINKGRHKKHKSVGLEITSRRVKLLNQPGQDDYKIDITDLYDDNGSASGTRITLWIPVNISAQSGEAEDWD